MAELVIKGLTADVAGRRILNGVDLRVASGEVHAVMGPNGAGKSTLSHVLLGKPGYEVLDGTVELDGVDLLALPTWKRAQAGLFLAMQYPTEVPGVSLHAMLEASFEASDRSTETLEATMASEADAIGFDRRFLERPLNVDLSGGEKKRNETLQLGVLSPRIAVLDEIDSGLDVDALADVSRRVEAMTEQGLGVLVITHYTRLLKELKADHVHVLARGRIVESGGPELADRLEDTGYAEFAEAEAATAASPSGSAAASDDPFADPFA